MYRGNSLYRITNVGRKLVRNIRPGNRNVVLDFIYPGGSATLEDVASNCFNGSGSRARMALRQLERKGLVEELTKG